MAGHKFAKKLEDAWDGPGLLDSIRLVNDWLLRLSNSVRVAGFESQNMRAAKYIPVDMGDEWPALLKNYYRSLIRRDCPHFQLNTASESEAGSAESADSIISRDSLIDRLAETMVIRHKRVVYRRFRYQRWAGQQLRTMLQPDVEKTRAVQPTSLEPIPEQQSALTERPVPLRITPRPVGLGAVSVLSERTTFDLPHFHPANRAAPSRISGVTTAVSVSQLPFELGDLFPPCPKGLLQEPEREFICPFCCMILPCEIGLSNRRWE